MNEINMKTALRKGMTKEERNQVFYQVRLTILEKLKEGLPQKEIAAMVGVSQCSVSKIKTDYETYGIEALQIYEKGKPWGREGCCHVDEKLPSRSLMGLV